MRSFSLSLTAIVVMCATAFASDPKPIAEMTPPEALRVGFQTGFSYPKRYKKYDSVPEAAIISTLRHCSEGKGLSNDCFIAAAIWGQRSVYVLRADNQKEVHRMAAISARYIHPK